MKKFLSWLLIACMLFSVMPTYVLAADEPSSVAKTGETEYESLQDAINAADGKTVTVIAEIELTEGVTVPAGKTVTLDLNGKTVSMSVAATKTSALITNNGTLTIKDSAENGKLTYVSSTVSTSYSTSTIINNGTLTVESGIIENTCARGGAPYAIDNHNTLTVKGGEITATDTTAIRQVQSGSNDNTVTVTGGTISGGYAGMQVHVMSNAKKTTTEITGGTFKSTYAFYTTFYNVTDSSNTEIEVSGGTFDGAVYLDNLNKGSTNLNVSITDGTFLDWIFVYTTDAGGNEDPVKAITGGTFATDVNEYCKDGYEVVNNGNGAYGIVVDLPEVVITDIKNTLTSNDPDLTFALNFAIKDVENLSEEYLYDLMNKYGDYYVDYALTISGLTDEDVTFNSNGSADGYLAGQYDAWSSSWVSVPFEDVTVANGESLYIMEYAAKLMGQSGLRFTLAEVAAIVQNFDCGVYFTPEFLVANPELKVTLQLKVFTEDADGNKIENIDVATNEFNVENVVAIVCGDGKQTQYYGDLSEALEAAASGETVKLLANIELTEGVTVPAGKTITLDLNGNSVSMSVAATETSALITNNGTLTIKDSAEDGKLTYVSSTVSTSYSTSTIINNGTLTVESGIIENTCARGGAPYAIDNHNTLTVNGGEITATYTTAIRQVQSGSNDNTVTVTGGTISGGYAGMQVHVMSNAKKTTTEITGGTFEGEYAFYTTFYNLTDSSNTEIEVSGGTFDGDVYLYNGNKDSKNLNVSITDGTFLGWTYVYTKDASGNAVPVKSITGGTFANDVNEYCKDSYVAVESAENVWVIISNTAVAYNVQQNKGYGDLSEALEAAASGDTVKLVADTVTEDYVLVYPGVTLNLNGKTLKAGYVVGFNGSDVIDSSEAKTGKLVVEKNNVVLDKANDMLPIYNGEGYVFITIIHSTSYNDKNDNVYRSSPKFGATTAEREFANELLANGYENSLVKVVVRVTWTDASGDYIGTQDYAYSDTFVNQVVTSMITNDAGQSAYTQRFIATFTSADIANASDVKVSTVIVSDTGAEIESEALIIDVQ